MRIAATHPKSQILAMYVGGSGHEGAGCRTWTYNGGTYCACTPGDCGLPGDPGSGGD